MYSAPNIFYFGHPIVKMVEMMVQRVDFERNLKNICPMTVEEVKLNRKNKRPLDSYTCLDQLKLCKKNSVKKIF